jgi:hypothetical protein
MLGNWFARPERTFERASDGVFGHSACFLYIFTKRAYFRNGHNEHTETALGKRVQSHRVTVTFHAPLPGPVPAPTRSQRTVSQWTPLLTHARSRIYESGSSGTPILARR